MIIDIDCEELERQVKRMSIPRDKLPKVMTKTANKTLTKMKGFTATEVSRTYTLKRNYVFQKISVRKNSNNLGGGVVKSTHRPTIASNFEHTPNTTPGKRGGAFVSVKVKKRGSTEEVEGAFIAPIKNSQGETVKDGVFVRSNKLNDEGRQILDAVYRPGVASAMNNEDVREVVLKRTEKSFETILDKEIDRVLREV